MKINRAVIAAGLLLLTALSAAAEGFTAFSKGDSECNAFLQAMDSERQATLKHPASMPGYDIFYTDEYRDFMMFADGFLTAANWAFALQGETTSPGTLTSMKGRALWLENFCRAEPLSHYVKALINLRRFLESQEGAITSGAHTP